MIWLTSGARPQFPPVRELAPGPDGLVALGGDLSPETILEAYGKGVFPWEGTAPYPWYSPDPRMVLVPGDFHASRSLRKLDRQRKLHVRADTHFCQVVASCAGTPRAHESGTWITPRLTSVWRRLHALGLAHSVETWHGDELVGGLYGLSVGGMFFGESMFSRRPDASKLAFWHLCRALEAADYDLVDCQAPTAHLRSLGAVPLPRSLYLDLLQRSWTRPLTWPGVTGG